MTALRIAQQQQQEQQKGCADILQQLPLGSSQQHQHQLNPGPVRNTTSHQPVAPIPIPPGITMKSADPQPVFDDRYGAEASSPFSHGSPTNMTMYHHRMQSVEPPPPPPTRVPAATSTLHALEKSYIMGDSGPHNFQASSALQYMPIQQEPLSHHHHKHQQNQHHQQHHQQQRHQHVQPHQMQQLSPKYQHTTYPLHQDKILRNPDIVPRDTSRGYRSSFDVQESNSNSNSSKPCIVSTKGPDGVPVFSRAQVPPKSSSNIAVPPQVQVQQSVHHQSVHNQSVSQSAGWTPFSSTVIGPQDAVAATATATTSLHDVNVTSFAHMGLGGGNTASIKSQRNGYAIKEEGIRVSPPAVPLSALPHSIPIPPLSTVSTSAPPLVAAPIMGTSPPPGLALAPAPVSASASASASAFSEHLPLSFMSRDPFVSPNVSSATKDKDSLVDHEVAFDVVESILTPTSLSKVSKLKNSSSPLDAFTRALKKFTSDTNSELSNSNHSTSSRCCDLNSSNHSTSSSKGRRRIVSMATDSSLLGGTRKTDDVDATNRIRE